MKYDEQLAKKLETEWNAVDIGNEEFPDTYTTAATSIFTTSTTSSLTAKTSTSTITPTSTTALTTSISTFSTTNTYSAALATNSVQRCDEVNTYEDVVKMLSTKVNHNEQFFLVTRRMVPLSRILSLWQRQAKKRHPTNVLKVRYAGEDGIDSGAISLEFFENSLQEMGKVMFPDGKPIESTYHVQNGNFRTCGQIVAASIAQGGPPPCFLEESSYQSAFKEIDMMNISSHDLTARENMRLEEIRGDCNKYTDLIFDNNYTGVIDEDHIEEIIRSLKVSFVTKRSLYMKEFMIGLNSYGLADIIRKYPEKCQPLFVNGDLKKGLMPDADYLFSALQPVYSEQGSSRKCIEEKMMDYFQDTLNAFEDERMTGHLSAVAWRDFKADDEDHEKEDEQKGQENPESFESASMNIPGVMGWLTGTQHKPINGEKLKVTVCFDHDCMQRNAKHTICFPQVSACARMITFPVAHMQSYEKFRELFVIAYCKGQAFGKP